MYSLIDYQRYDLLHIWQICNNKAPPTQDQRYGEKHGHFLREHIMISVLVIEAIGNPVLKYMQQYEIRLKKCSHILKLHCLALLQYILNCDHAGIELPTIFQSKSDRNTVNNRNKMHLQENGIDFKIYINDRVRNYSTCNVLNYMWCGF